MPLPAAFLQSIRTVPGFDAPAFCAVHEDGSQVTSVRINPDKITAEEAVGHFKSLDITATPIPWCDNGLHLDKRPSFTLDPLLHAGAYYVQEASSMFLWEVLRQTCTDTTGKRVLDLCAAPGGKSGLLASWFRDGLLVSNEVIKSRVHVLQENLTKWGSSQVVITNNDAADFSRLPGYFDVIVADVPCSGSGLFRRDPEAVNEWSEANVKLCSQRQQRILADVIPSLNEGGTFIYSTCSYSSQEDEEILDWIVEQFQLTSVPLQLNAEWQVVETRSEKHHATGYRFFPDKVKGEGFFIAAFRQEQPVVTVKLKEAALGMASTKEIAALQELVDVKECAVFMHHELMHLFPAAHLRDLRVLSQALYIRQAGIAAGSIKGKSLVPEHALALSNITTAFPVIALSLEASLQFLRRQEMQVDGPVGWCAVAYDVHRLGWIKKLPNRINNYYPAEWRILKS